MYMCFYVHRKHLESYKSKCKLLPLGSGTEDLGTEGDLLFIRYPFLLLIVRYVIALNFSMKNC